MTAEAAPAPHDTELKRTITGKLLYFYVVGDVLGAGIYVLIGVVAAEVGGAFWLSFLVGVAIATLTGLAYAELVTKYPRAAGAALFVQKAFRSSVLTFFVTVCMLSALFAASGTLASGFALALEEVWSAPPELLVSILLVAALTVVNYLGITESVVMNMIMTFVEVAGLTIIIALGVWWLISGKADAGVLTDFADGANPVLAVVAGMALAFFAMTGFENTANVAEECVDPGRTYPRALIFGMITAGTVYVLVSMSAALILGASKLAGEAAPLVAVAEVGLDSLPAKLVTVGFGIIAMVAITNTTLVGIVTQPRILYGMAREDVVPGVFAKLDSRRKSPVAGLVLCFGVVAALLFTGWLLIELGFDLVVVDRLAAVTVVFLLAIYALVIVCALKLRSDSGDAGDHFRANTLLLLLGLAGNVGLFVYTVYNDPFSLLWCAGLIAVGVVLFLIEYFFGSTDRPSGVGRGDPSAAR